MFNRSWVSISALCFLISALPSWAAPHPSSAIRAFNDGVKVFNAEKFNEAIPYFDDAISKDGDFPEAFYARGVCRYHLKGMDGAILDLSDAVRLKPDLFDARAMRGVVYYESSRWDQALEDFNYVLNHQPQDAQSLLGRGVIHLQREESEPARRDFKAFLRSHPNHPLAPKVRQLVAQLSGQTPEEAAGEQAGEGAKESSEPSPVHRTARSKRVSAQAQALGASLLMNSHEISERFGRQALHGSGGEATGDFHASSPGSKSPDNGPQIVDPQ